MCEICDKSKGGPIASSHAAQILATEGFCECEPVEVGNIHEINGHQMKVREVKEASFDQRRVKLSCAPGCCTTPYNVEMEMAEKTLLTDFNRR